jgi:hypothetical protein
MNITDQSSAAASKPALVISLDFEMFWGMFDSKTIDDYGANIEGEWQAVPAILNLFKRYGIHATWATVGMLMCKDYRQWYYLRPRAMPTYSRGDNLSTYSATEQAKEHPSLFFGLPLVEQILATEGQELGSHTYSHFYCGEPGVTTEQFSADMECQQAMFFENGVKATSLVFPRNQVLMDYLDIASAGGTTSYRGNQEHWIYRDGHFVPFGYAGRLVRKADGYFSMSGKHVAYLDNVTPSKKLVNVPASMFLQPTLGNRVLDTLHLNRVKKGMLAAAKTGGVFHLWWHPHNFGTNLKRNLENLESILQFYFLLAEKYAMQSMSMSGIADARSISTEPVRS